MPFADPDKKKEYMRDWRKTKMKEGYGKWLYARRKLRFDDAERFRKALEEIVELSSDSEALDEAHEIAHTALKESRKAEEALGWFA